MLALHCELGWVLSSTAIVRKHLAYLEPAQPRRRFRAEIVQRVPTDRSYSAPSYNSRARKPPDPLPPAGSYCLASA
jgi:hypothetical protein